MKLGSDSAARLQQLPRSASHRLRGRADSWPRLVSVTFVVAFNVAAWGAVAAVIYVLL